MNIDIVNLVEYDIQAAVFSIIINEKLYDKFEKINLHELNTVSANKYLRNVLIGNYQRVIPGLAQVLTDKYKEILEKFKLLNNISEKDIYFKTKDSLIFHTTQDIIFNIDNYIFIHKNSYSYYFEYKNKNMKRQVFLGNENFSIKGITRILNDNYPIFKFFFSKMITKYILTKSDLQFFIDGTEVLELCRKEMYKNQIDYEVEYNNFIVKIDHLPHLTLHDIIFTEEVFQELNSFVKTF